MVVWILDKATARPLDLFRQTPRLQVSLNAQAVRDGQRIGGRGIGDRPAAPQRRHPEFLEGLTVEADEIGLHLFVHRRFLHNRMDLRTYVKKQAFESSGVGMTSHASFWEAVKGALHSLRSSKLRSFLTLLGIILSTTTLIAVMSVIAGMDVYIAENVSNMGADGYRVQRMVMLGFDPKKYVEMLRRNPQLTRAEYDFLRERATM